MANVELWSGVAVAMTSAEGAAQTITAITKASPAVVTTSGTAPPNGSIVYLSVQGMNQVHERAFRTAGLSGSTFQLEGLDATTYDTFSSGTFRVQTMGTTLTSASDVSASGGEAEQVDISTIHDTRRKTRPGPTAAASYTFTCFWDPSDAGLLAMTAAADKGTQLVFQMTWPSGVRAMFAGSISATLLPTGSGQQPVTTTVTVTMNGRPTYYAS